MDSQWSAMMSANMNNVSGRDRNAGDHNLDLNLTLGLPETNQNSSPVEQNLNLLHGATSYRDPFLNISGPQTQGLNYQGRRLDAISNDQRSFISNNVGRGPNIIPNNARRSFLNNNNDLLHTAVRSNVFANNNRRGFRSNSGHQGGLLNIFSNGRRPAINVNRPARLPTNMMENRARPGLLIGGRIPYRPSAGNNNFNLNRNNNPPQQRIGASSSSARNQGNDDDYIYLEISRNRRQRVPSRDGVERYRRCTNFYCRTHVTPMWRYGPKGHKSLCNACGIVYKKEQAKMLAQAAMAAAAGMAAAAAAEEEESDNDSEVEVPV